MKKNRMWKLKHKLAGLDPKLLKNAGVFLTDERLNNFVADSLLFRKQLLNIEERFVKWWKKINSPKVHKGNHYVAATFETTRGDIPPQTVQRLSGPFDNIRTDVPGNGSANRALRWEELVRNGDIKVRVVYDPNVAKLFNSPEILKLQKQLEFLGVITKAYHKYSSSQKSVMVSRIPSFDPKNDEKGEIDLYSEGVEL